MYKNLFSLYLKNYEWLVGILGSILVFRKPATIAIIIFLVLHCVFFKSIRWNKKAKWSIIVIAAPFLLDLLFIWNNELFADGLKHTEKRFSLLLFPLLIICQGRRLNLFKTLWIYVSIFTAILTVLFIRFTIIDTVLVIKYLNGIHLWEIGYSFAASMGLHAPAVNMHVAFLVMAIAYLLFNKRPKQVYLIIVHISLLVISIFYLLVLNTRIAVVVGLVGLLCIVFLNSVKKLRKRNALIFTSGTLLLLCLMLFAFAKANTYMLEKYTKDTFKNLDMVGRLDEFDNPEGEVFSSLVTRVSIWKTAFERAMENPWIGVGAADGKDELHQAYIDTNQVFLAKYKFPTHNQYLDFFLKFGVLGLAVVLLFMTHIFFLSIKLRNSLVLMFFTLFAVSNLTDDFLIRFDGITFSALWVSIFANIYWHNRLDRGPATSHNSLMN